MSDERVAQSNVRKGSVRDLLYVIFGHKKKMLVFMVLLFGVVAIKTLVQPSTYRSEAKLLLRIGRENVSLDPTATVGEVVGINRSYDWEINSELEIIKSREIAERVVDEMGASVLLHGSGTATPDSNEALATVKPADEALRTVKNTLDIVADSPGKLANSLGLSEPVNEREKAIRRLTDNLKVEAQQNTSVIDLAYEERNPEAAKSTLDRFIQAYLEKHLTVYCMANSQQFFERQVLAVAREAHGCTEGASESQRHDGDLGPAGTAQRHGERDRNAGAEHCRGGGRAGRRNRKDRGDTEHTGDSP